MRLSSQTEQARRRADLLEQRDQALTALAELLDPDRALSCWSLAGVLSGRLRRFRSAAYHRIVQGGREPYSPAEAALAACCAASCPTSQRKLFDLLAELGF